MQNARATKRTDRVCRVLIGRNHLNDQADLLGRPRFGITFLHDLARAVAVEEYLIVFVLLKLRQISFDFGAQPLFDLGKICNHKRVADARQTDAAEAGVA